MLIFLLFTNFGKCLASLQSVAINCQFPSSEANFLDEELVYRCFNNGNLILHTKVLNDSVPTITQHMDFGWVEIQMGQTKLIPQTPEPISSCLSSVEGNGGIKSVTNTEAIYLTMAGSLKFPLFNILFLHYSVTPGIGLRVRLSRIIEYGCAVSAGQTVQILQKYNNYILKDWKFRPVNFEADSNDLFYIEPWQEIPDITLVEESETVMCATRKELLQCRM